MLWRKKQPIENSATVKVEKLDKPRGIPDAVGRYMVVNLAKHPDWVWDLKCAMRERTERHTFDIRVFDARAASSNGIAVRDYTSLDSHPELILCEGIFDKRSHTFRTEQH